MKHYMHPLSTTSRPVSLFIADNNIDVEEQVVDLMTGEHLKPPYSDINPNCLVPMLEDGDFRLTESSAALKYLADKIDSPAYPKDLKQRARVNEMMDWFNTNFYRNWGYGLIYPQLFPDHKRRSDEAQAATIEWGRQHARRWLVILNDHWIGPQRQFLCGNQITIADYFGAGLMTLGDSIRCDFSAYPNVQRWFNTMKKRPGWSAVNQQFYGLCEAVKGQSFVAI
jgi:glutathione S-transferase